MRPRGRFGFEELAENRKVASAFLIILLIPTLVWATVNQTGWTIEKTYRNLDESQSVVLATVTEVEYGDGEDGHLFTTVRMILHLEVHSVLGGSPQLSCPVVSGNTFAGGPGGWFHRSGGGGRWILPGDRGVFLLHHAVEKGEKGALWCGNIVKNVGFLPPGDLNEDTVIQDHVGFQQNKTLADPTDPTTTYQQMISSVSVDTVDTPLTLGDVFEALDYHPGLE